MANNTTIGSASSGGVTAALESILNNIENAVAGNTLTTGNTGTTVKAQENAAGIRTKNTFGIKPTYMTASPTLEGAPLSTGFSSYVEDEMARSLNLVNRMGSDWYNKFSRNGIVDPFTANTTTKEYIFITKPDLHLFDGSGIPNTELTKSSSFFKDNLIRYREIATQLQLSVNGAGAGPFMNILSNAFVGNVDVPSLSAETFDTANNVHGTHITYRGTSIDSDMSPEVTIEFKDNKYLEVYTLLKMYDEYERIKWMGLVTPPTTLYTYRKILHDQVTLYKIVVGDDGMSIRYWARWVGGMVTSLPRDYFGSTADGEIQFSTSWKFNFFSDMDPIILTDFNRICSQAQTGKKICPLYDMSLHGANPEWPSIPCVYVNKGTSKEARYNKYFLLWLA